MVTCASVASRNCLKNWCDLSSSPLFLSPAAEEDKVRKCVAKF
jgi:hypothetical protein